MDTEIIRRIAIFSELPDDEIENLVNNLHWMRYPAGQVILHEGQISRSCFILMEGEVEIIKSIATPDERILAVRSAGELLGDMSLFSHGRKHTASVRASTSIKLLEMTKADFDVLIQRHAQVAYKMADQLSKRLEDSENLIIRDLREKNRQLTQAYQELQAAQAQIVIKERLEQELEIARNIQASVLIHEMPEIPGYSLGALMVPARAVGGDFYDFVPLRDGKWAITIGDVSDKGTPAALFMALTFSLLRATAKRCNHPAEALQEVNVLLSEMNASGMFVTLVYAFFDPISGELTYARAGHPYPLITSGSGAPVQGIKQPGQPLGLFERPLLDVQHLTLEPGGVALLYSDGLSEAENAQGEFYDDQRVIGMMTEPTQNAQDLCQRIWDDVKTFTGDAQQHDDFTVVAIKRWPAER
jgi:serine phosphatase RsbU (regulator of sigma subunit)